MFSLYVQFKYILWIEENMFHYFVPVKTIFLLSYFFLNIPDLLKVFCEDAGMINLVYDTCRFEN